MYELPIYRDDSVASVLATLRANPLALVATNHGDVPIATHAPVVFWRGPDDADEADTTTLVGATLVGHMNVRNPQWTEMADGDRVLVVFQGPHGYVSPVVYGVTPAAPTWDFTAVHVTGTVRPTAERADVLDVVRHTVLRLEAAFGLGWDMASSQEYFESLAPGVGAFELHVESVRTMFKHSQEQPPERRQRVIDGFAASRSGTHRELAAMMRARGLACPAENLGTTG